MVPVYKYPANIPRNHFFITEKLFVGDKKKFLNIFIQNIMNLFRVYKNQVEFSKFKWQKKGFDSRFGVVTNIY